MVFCRCSAEVIKILADAAVTEYQRQQELRKVRVCLTAVNVVHDDSDRDVENMKINVVQTLAQRSRQLLKRTRAGRLTLQHPLLSEDKERKTPLFWALQAERATIDIVMLLRMCPEAVNMCSWAGNTPVHLLVKTAMQTPEAVVHVDASIFTEDGKVRKLEGRSHDELLEVLNQMLELWPDAIYVKNTEGFTPFDLVCGLAI